MRWAPSYPLLRAFTLTTCLVVGGEAAASSSSDDYDILPSPLPADFHGRIGLRVGESVPYWPQPLQPPPGAPNIFMILIDDAGFGATSTFGGPIPTPTFDSIAKRGLKYTSLHTTALCSPTRAALLTGRNHHSVHAGMITEMSTGFPGYDTLMPKDAVSVAEILRQIGYNTLWVGKNHNVPEWQTSQAGPFDHWYTGNGFEHFRGFVGGDTNQWRPTLFEGVKPIEPYLNNKDYILNTDLADYTISYIERQKSLAPHKPFFAYYAPGATHAPHHAPKEWIEKFEGKFDHGWDRQREMTYKKQLALGVIPPHAKLTPRPDQIPSWDSAPPDHKKLYARMMEVYAAFMAHTDYEIGRVINRIKKMGLEDDTMVLLMIGDNGASGEGTLTGVANEASFFNGVKEDFNYLLEHLDDFGSDWGYNLYPVGWAWAMNTPFQWMKQVASHYGGTRNPLVISWPSKITPEYQGGIREQWHHVVDIAPTILEAIGVGPPTIINGVAQRPYDGVPLGYTFFNATAPSTRQTQYFEMWGNQGLYDNGWMASTTPVDLPWIVSDSDVDPIKGMAWELYHVEEDPTQYHNLAQQYPDKLEEMRETFYLQASKYNVLPIDNSRVNRFDERLRPSYARGRREFHYYEGMTRIPESAGPDMAHNDFTITADVVLSSDVANGVIVTIGGKFTGWVWYLRNGHLVFHYNLAGVYRYEVASPHRISKGSHKLGLLFEFHRGPPGRSATVTLFVDGRKVQQGLVNQTMKLRCSTGETLDIGQDTGTAAAPDYDVPHKLQGKIREVIITLQV